jgi:hypothetical protein
MHNKKNPIDPCNPSHLTQPMTQDMMVGVIIFGSVQFLSIKTTKPKFCFFKKTEIVSSLVPTDRFQFGSVFYVKNKKNLYCFLTSKSHKIKPIFITSNLHDSVESILAFS